jgi:thioredoxin:protein disulfide reductase
MIRTMTANPLYAVLSLLAAVASSPALPAAPQPELLEPETAFRISTRALDERHAEVRFEIADGYYMYRDRFRFETAAGKVLADVQLPKGKVKDDPFFGKTETYRREVRVRVPLTQDQIANRRVTLKVTSQGCADVGVCYMPLEQFVEIGLAGTSSNAPAASPPQSFWRKGTPKMPHQGPATTPQGGSR